jgi:hypothetical protein
MSGKHRDFSRGAINNERAIIGEVDRQQRIGRGKIEAQQEVDRLKRAPEGGDPRNHVSRGGVRFNLDFLNSDGSPRVDKLAELEAIKNGRKPTR